MNYILSKAAMAALAGCLLAGEAAAQQTVDITVCNNTRDKLVVSISFIPVGAGPNDWLTKGWYTLGRSACQYIAQTEMGTFYGYAERSGDGSLYWGGSLNVCVQYPGPYEIWAPKQCGRNQTSKPFAKLSTSQFGPYTWNLNP